MRVAEKRNKTERRPARRLRNACHRIGEQCGVATKFVDDEPAYQACVLGLGHGFGADDASDHAATVDVADQHDRNIGSSGKTHIGDVVGTEIDLGGAAGALDQHEIGRAAQMPVALQDGGQQIAFHVLIGGGLGAAVDAALHDNLRADLALRFE